MKESPLIDSDMQVGLMSAHCLHLFSDALQGGSAAPLRARSTHACKAHAPSKKHPAIGTWFMHTLSGVQRQQCAPTM